MPTKAAWPASSPGRDAVGHGQCGASQCIRGQRGGVPRHEAHLWQHRLCGRRGLRALHVRPQLCEGGATFGLVAPDRGLLSGAAGSRNLHHGPQPRQQTCRCDGETRHDLARCDLSGTPLLGAAQLQHRPRDLAPPTVRHGLHARVQGREAQRAGERGPPRTDARARAHAPLEERHPLHAHGLRLLAQAGHPIEVAGCRRKPLRGGRLHNLVAELVKRQQKSALRKRRRA
mmetsp:Transcript_56180/g.162801  ORF Transcript_56180/g.162801 Transcript_56180/m.162801 type:complete len:230 (+) Transcript_56180:48-737(+)